MTGGQTSSVPPQGVLEVTWLHRRGNSKTETGNEPQKAPECCVAHTVVWGWSLENKWSVAVEKAGTLKEVGRSLLWESL